MCYMEPDCVAINIRPGKDGKYDCELNDATEEKRALHNKKNYVYLGIEVNLGYLQNFRGALPSGDYLT